MTRHEQDDLIGRCVVDTLIFVSESDWRTWRAYFRNLTGIEEGSPRPDGQRDRVVIAFQEYFDMSISVASTIVNALYFSHDEKYRWERS